MNSALGSTRWKTLFALMTAALMTLSVACSDDADNNANNSNGEADAGESNSNDDPDSGNNDDDDTGEDQQGLEELNLDGESGIVEDADGSWLFTATSQDQSQFVQIALTGDQATEGGSVEFEEATSLESDNAAFFLDGEATYMTTSGTLEIDTFEADEAGGDFEARLVGNELVEVQISQEDGSVSEVPDGLTGQLDEEMLSGAVEPWVEFEPSCDLEGFEAADATMQATAGDGTMSASAATSEEEPNDLISIFLSDNAEDTFEIDDFRLSECENCALLDQECTTSDQGLACEKTFMAGAGEIEVTSTGSVDDQFTATLRNAEFAEAEIDWFSGETRLVQDGEGWCVDEFQFDATIEEQDTGG